LWRDLLPPRLPAPQRDGTYDPSAQTCSTRRGRFPTKRAAGTGSHRHEGAAAPQRRAQSFPIGLVAAHMALTPPEQRLRPAVIATRASSIRRTRRRRRRFPHCRAFSSTRPPRLSSPSLRTRRRRSARGRRFRGARRAGAPPPAPGTSSAPPRTAYPSASRGIPPFPAPRGRGRTGAEESFHGNIISRLARCRSGCPNTSFALLGYPRRRKNGGHEGDDSPADGQDPGR